jgi:hypothetical protein
MQSPFLRNRDKDPEWYPTAPREGIDRKERSEATLRAEKVPINRYLPLVETESLAVFRPKEQIVPRIVALTLVAVKGEGALTNDQLQDLVNRFEAADCFSPCERLFMEKPAPSHQDRIEFSWRYESLWIMLWSLGYVPSLSRPQNLCDVPLAVGFLRDLGPNGLLEKAIPRSLRDLLDWADLIVRYHWAVRDAQLTGKPIPSDLNPEVVREWHYALNWLVQDVAWDEVDTST